MKEVIDIRSALVPSSGGIKCPMCGKPMKRVSWKITAAAFDAGKEVEQTVFQCGSDKGFISFEVSTGNPSEFAFTDYSQDDLYKPEP